MTPDQEQGYHPQEQLLKRIPDLVERSIFGRAARAKQASQTLIERTSNSPFFDPVLVAVDAVQRRLLSGYDASALNNATGLLSEMIHQAGGNLPEGRDTKIINITPELVEVVERIARNGQKLQRDPKLASTLPVNYTKLVADIPPYVRACLNSGIKTAELIFTRPVREGEDLQKREADRKRWDQWVGTLSEVFKSQESEQGEAERIDNFIDLVREEPEQDIFREKKLFNAQYAGISLADIEQLPHPLSEEDYARVTDYLLGLFSDRPNNLRVEEVDTLFFKSKLFSGPTGLTVYKNAALLSRLNSWQEQFVQRIIVQKDQSSDDQVRSLLILLPPASTTALLTSLYLWFTHPHELDPAFTGDYQTRPYFIYDQAIADYQNSHPDEIIPSKYGDEIAIDYFKAKILPILEERLRVLGIEENFRIPMQILNRMLQERPYEQEHLHAAREVFEKNCGEEFLQKLTEHSGEIDEITERALKSVSEGGIHFLPMQRGMNTINFSPNSLPDILGLKSISFNRMGGMDDWQLMVIYSFSDTHFKLLGFLDQNGQLKFKAPLKQEIPGLYTMLRHIAVLSFRDLVVQERMEKEEQDATAKTADQAPLIEGQEKEAARKIAVTHRGVSHAGTLPREQTDRQLIGYIYRKTNITPRVVEVHPTGLPGAKEYLNCLNLYQKAVDNGLSEAEIEERRKNLELARQRAYQTSEAKRKSVPARLKKLATIRDPITDKERYLETWVIEHTVPKPTEEELQSPVKLYERYYRRASSLAFLEQLKPWFIGQ